jgi:single-strand DNA-binding protein
MVNRIVLIGRLTRDPELRTTNTGKNMATFGVAVQKRMKPQDGSPDADFFNVKAWGQTAEYASNYLTKGRLVAIDGRMESRKYTDQQGNNREIWEVVADNVNGLDRPKDDAGGNAGGGGQAYAGGQSSGNSPRQPAVAAAPSADEYDPFADD